MIINLITALILLQVTLCGAEEWDFLLIADWHGSEFFAKFPGNETKYYRAKLQELKYIKNNYGGDIVVMPGDTNNGKWFSSKFRDSFNRVRWDMSLEETILLAGENCYRTLRNLFLDAGYKKILVAIGDHELGDNGWHRKEVDDKTLSVPLYRQSFSKALYKDQDDKFIYNQKIGKAAPTPWKTDYRFTSFAHRHNNVLFVTVDTFFFVSNEEFLDRTRGLGGQGVITGDVRDDHLDWFEEVLIEARKDPRIKHIIVQSHLPVLQPVRKTHTSSMFFDRAQDSKFWKIMRKYSVDIYFAGEVHSFTVTKDENSDLLQVVTRGNSLDTFSRVSVTDEVIRLEAFEKTVDETFDDPKYENNGSLVIDKSGATNITSSGVFKLLDVSKPLIHFDFEEIDRIENRQVYGMSRNSITKKIEIRGVPSNMSLLNKGVFGEQYDAQVANLGTPVGSGIYGNHGGQFTPSTRMAVYSIGPLCAGEVISYSTWFKTSSSIDIEMILIHYGPSWGSIRQTDDKNMFTLTIDDGRLKLYANRHSILEVDDENKFNDSQFHHVAVSMPHQSCLLSEVLVFVDGILMKTVVSNDINLYFIPHSRLSLGGLGYSATLPEDFPKWQSFNGTLDEFYLYGRRMWRTDLKEVMRKNFRLEPNSKCKGQAFEIKFIAPNHCRRLCSTSSKCWGYENKDLGVANQCTLFNYSRPNVEAELNGSLCYIVV